MNRRLKSDFTDLLFESILKLSSLEECYDFFEDLCTVSEIKAMSQRIMVAKLLNDGNVYNDVAKETGASTATISRVARALEYGADGYKLAISRLNLKNE